MSAVVDTHAEIKKLVGGGTFTLEQAEAIIDLFLRVTEGTANPRGLSGVATAADHQCQLLRSDMKEGFAAGQVDLRATVSKAKVQILLAVVGVGILQMGLITGLVLKLAH